jgi:N-acyl-D-aspartate/D-glutamate deacylase
MYVYTAGGTGLDITVPNWVWEQGAKRGLERLKDPSVRVRLKKEIAAGSMPGWSNLIEASGGWEHIVLANAFNPKYDRYRYKSIDYIAKQLGQDPADVRLYDRGAIREGLKADVTIFNEERIEDVATYENPTSYPLGIDYVLVNGQLVIDQGRHTGAKPGSVLRGAGADIKRASARGD